MAIKMKKKATIGEKRIKDIQRKMEIKIKKVKMEEKKIKANGARKKKIE